MPLTTRLHHGALVAIVVLGAIVWVGCCTGIFDEIIPRRQVVTPVLVMPIDLRRTESHSSAFELGRGRYSVNVQMKLRHGPQSSHATDRGLSFRGTAAIVDSETHIKLRHDFDVALDAYEVQAKLFEFEANDVGRHGEKTFRISVDAEPDFLENYSEVTLFIKRELRYRILD